MSAAKPNDIAWKGETSPVSSTLQRCSTDALVIRYADLHLPSVACFQEPVVESSAPCDGRDNEWRRRRASCDDARAVCQRSDLRPIVHRQVVLADDPVRALRRAESVFHSHLLQELVDAVSPINAFKLEHAFRRSTASQFEHTRLGSGLRAPST